MKPRKITITNYLLDREGDRDPDLWSDLGLERDRDLCLGLSSLSLSQSLRLYARNNNRVRKSHFANNGLETISPRLIERTDIITSKQQCSVEGESELTKAPETDYFQLIQVTQAIPFSSVKRSGDRQDVILDSQIQNCMQIKEKRLLVL